jgi:hypothetical protein
MGILQTFPQGISKWTFLFLSIFFNLPHFFFQILDFSFLR